MTQTSTLAVEGMSCAGCENNVRFALSALPGIGEAEPDHVANTVRVRFDAEVTDLATICRAIEDIGYRVLDRNP